MGKAGRFACVFLPMAMTIASLICLVIVGLGGIHQSSSTLNNHYFFRANTSNISVDPTLFDLPANPVTGGAVNGTASVVGSYLGIQDFYHVGLWNYCSGNFTHSGTDNVTFCSPRQSEYWFNPVEVWKLSNNTFADKFFPTEIKDGLKTYQTVAKWMFVAYVIAVISLAVEILVGTTALLSRWGSLATTIVSSISSVFVIAFALTSTILYASLVGTFDTALKKYNIHADLGRSMYVYVWLAVVFSFASGIFWMFSSCCCSGRSNRIRGYGDGAGRKAMRAERTPYTYERVESPLMGLTGHAAQPGYQNPQHGYPMGNMGPPRATAYEPFRHEDHV